MNSRGQTAWVQSLAAAVMLIGSISTRANAQWRSAVAVGGPAAVIGEGRQIDRHAIAVPNEDTWRTRDLWKWIGIGALGGFIAADACTALVMARDHSEGGMIPPIIPLAIIGAAGGVGGGLIGAIGYTALHPSPEPSPQ